MKMDSFDKGLLAMISVGALFFLALMGIVAYSEIHTKESGMELCGQICENGVERFDHGNCFCK